MLDCWECMQENSPLAITTDVEGRYMLWTQGKIRLCNCWRRSLIICCRGCLVWNWGFRERRELRDDVESIRATAMEVSSRRRVTSVFIELAPRGYEVTESPCCLDACHYVRDNFWLLQMPPRSFAYQSLRKRSQKSGVDMRSFHLDACGQRRI